MEGEADRVSGEAFWSIAGFGLAEATELMTARPTGNSAVSRETVFVTPRLFLFP
jgi:hypothetical protein